MLETLSLSQWLGVITILTKGVLIVFHEGKLKSRNKPIECHDDVIYLSLLLGLNRPLDKSIRRSNPPFQEGICQDCQNVLAS